MTRPRVTRAPLLDLIYGAEWAEKIQRVAFAPKGEKKKRQAELKAYVTARLAAETPARRAAA